MKSPVVNGRPYCRSTETRSTSLVRVLQKLVFVRLIKIDHFGFYMGIYLLYFSHYACTYMYVHLKVTKKPTKYVQSINNCDFDECNTVN